MESEWGKLFSAGGALEFDINPVGEALGMEEVVTGSFHD
jgi:hypothetical protein